MTDAPRSWRDRLAGFTRDIQDELDRVTQQLGLVAEGKREHEIIAYRSHGSRQRVLVQGRVISCRRFRGASATDSAWTNLLNTYRRIDSDALPHAQVSVKVGKTERTVNADDEGFFREWIDLAEPLDGIAPWAEAELELAAGEAPAVKAKA